MRKREGGGGKGFWKGKRVFSLLRVREGMNSVLRDESGVYFVREGE